MSLERVLKTLEGFGLSRVEAEVYVYLAKAGPSKINQLANSLKITREELFSALRSLKKKGIVEVSFKHDALFSALTFEELVNRYVKLHVKQAQILKENKQQLIDSWRKMIEKNIP